MAAMPHRFRPRTITLRDGAALTVRRLEPGDKELLAAGFERLSEHSRYRRFMSPMPRMSPALLSALTEIDHCDHEALVAIDRASGQLSGVARYIRSTDDREAAEVAVTVADDWQRRGVGRALLELLTDRARHEGIRRFTALVLAENRSAMGLLSTLGETDVRPGGSELGLVIELPAHRGIGAQLAEALRAVASGALVARRTPLPPPRLGRPIRTIVVGTDGSETAARAVAVAVGLAARAGGTLHVVSAHRTAGAAGRATAALEDATAAARGAGLDAVTHARRGNAADALVAVALDADADLVVVGNRGMTGVARHLLGSVPDRLSHHAPCSVLIVRTTGARAT
jgi:nucleotide-binding universal stress UspA family protein/GNAT superfamily N-acetyltransferase